VYYGEKELFVKVCVGGVCDENSPTAQYMFSITLFRVSERHSIVSQGEQNRRVNPFFIRLMELKLMFTVKLPHIFVFNFL